jgi:hypothetical protein
MDAFGGLCLLAVAERGREGGDEEIWCNWCDWCESYPGLPPWADGDQETHGNTGEYQSFFYPAQETRTGRVRSSLTERW